MNKDEKYRAELMKYIPEHCSILDPDIYSSSRSEEFFHFDIEKIKNDALSEGYVVLSGEYNYYPDGRIVKFNSLKDDFLYSDGRAFNSVVESAPFHARKWPDLVCCIFFANDLIAFRKREYFKGQPGRRWLPHRDDDKPCSYSRYNIGWCKDGTYHRENDLPAALSFNSIDWCNNGKWYRENGPAIIRRHSQSWYNNHVFVKTEDK